MVSFFIDLYSLVFSLFIKREDADARRLRAQMVCVSTAYVFLLNAFQAIEFFLHYNVLGFTEYWRFSKYIIGIPSMIIGFLAVRWFAHSHTTLQSSEAMLARAGTLSKRRKLTMSIVTFGNIALFFLAAYLIRNRGLRF
jgi:hypothetical protein